LLVLVLAIVGTAPAGAAPPPGLSLSPSERSALLSAFTKAGRAQPDRAMPDGELWTRVERLASLELGQTLKPGDIDPFWALAAAPRQVDREMSEARAAGRLESWTGSLSPGDEAYAALARTRLHLSGVIGQGGWPRLSEGPVLRQGNIGPGVLALRRRLEAEGDAASGAPAPDRFDPDLRSALSDYQSRNGLEVDGVLGPATLRHLNTPAEFRLAQVDANMERRRWMPRSLPEDRLEIDTGAATGALYRGGRIVHAFRVIPGSVKDPTPIFASRLNAIVLNPPWNVPDRIAREEILPKAARDPGYLARNDYVRIGGRLQQQPGPKAALGLVKFDLVSPFGVYLHDTPGREAFRRRERHLSHGCMRVEFPQVLADLLLAPQGRGGKRMQADLATGATLRIALTRQEPLYVVHWTAIPGPEGRIGYLDDVYGWDARLATALSGL
jgi:murein L,D-transpeptidase YcbB/YkuD